MNEYNEFYKVLNFFMMRKSVVYFDKYKSVFCYEFWENEMKFKLIKIDKIAVLVHL